MKPILTAEMRPRQNKGDAADKMATLSLEQVAQLSGVGPADLKGLVDWSVLKPVSDPWAFRLDCVVTLQRADQLRQDMALDGDGFALAMMLLGQITDLENESHTTAPKLPTEAPGRYLMVVD